MPACVRIFCLLCLAQSVSGCAPFLSFLGTNQTLVQGVAQVERVKVAGDGASYAASSKTITDHALSAAAGMDCKVFNVFSRDPLCRENNADTKVSVGPDPEARSIPQPKEQATPENEMRISVPTSDLAGG